MTWQIRAVTFASYTQESTSSFGMNEAVLLIVDETLDRNNGNGILSIYGSKDAGLLL